MFCHMIGEMEAFAAEEFRFHIYLDNVNDLLDGGTFLDYYMIRTTYKEGFFLVKKFILV